jgi:hypothetical protein
MRVYDIKPKLWNLHGKTAKKDDRARTFRALTTVIPEDLQRQAPFRFLKGAAGARLFLGVKLISIKELGPIGPSAYKALDRRSRDDRQPCRPLKRKTHVFQNRGPR